MDGLSGPEGHARLAGLQLQVAGEPLRAVGIVGPARGLATIERLQAREAELLTRLRTADAEASLFVGAPDADDEHGGRAPDDQDAEEAAAVEAPLLLQKPKCPSGGVASGSWSRRALRQPPAGAVSRSSAPAW